MFAQWSLIASSCRAADTHHALIISAAGWLLWRHEDQQDLQTSEALNEKRWRKVGTAAAVGHKLQLHEAAVCDNITDTVSVLTDARVFMTSWGCSCSCTSTCRVPGAQQCKLSPTRILWAARAKAGSIHTPSSYHGDKHSDVVTIVTRLFQMKPKTLASFWTISKCWTLHDAR